MQTEIKINVDDDQVRAALADMALFHVATLTSIVVALHRQDLCRFDRWPDDLRALAARSGEQDAMLPQLAQVLARNVERALAPASGKDQPQGDARPGHLRVVD
ncbi:MAG: hypothetical protein ABI697_07080 [Devosia sp.]